jgi:hypothetical protein
MLMKHLRLNDLPAIGLLPGTVLVILLLASCPENNKGSAHNGVNPNCEDWATITLGEYEVSNNPWGKGGISDYTQCIYTEANGVPGGPVYMGWYWQWPWVMDGVKAYPAVLYGHKPWNNYSTTEHLPQMIDRLNHLSVSFDVNTESRGAVNLLLESWITTSAEITPEARYGELAIQLYQKNWPGQEGDYVKPVVIDGIPFDFYIAKTAQAPGDNGIWIYFGFVHKGAAINKGKVDIMDFVDFLMSEGYVEGSYYVATVELGNEIDHGKGETVIKQFSVEVENKD